jgi:hypothetical protein
MCVISLLTKLYMHGLCRFINYCHQATNLPLCTPSMNMILEVQLLAFFSLGITQTWVVSLFYPGTH